MKRPSFITHCLARRCCAARHLYENSAKGPLAELRARIDALDADLHRAPNTLDDLKFVLQVSERGSMWPIRNTTITELEHSASEMPRGGGGGGYATVRINPVWLHLAALCR